MFGLREKAASRPRFAGCAAKPVTLDASRLHATCGWRGLRLVLIGYTVEHFDTMHPKRLEQLGLVEPGPKRRRDMSSGPELEAAAAATGPIATDKVSFRTLAVDCDSKRTNFPITRMDLTKKSDLLRLIEIIDLERDSIDLIHLAPPCGTASGARGRPLPAFEALGLPVPKALRSTKEPQGLSTLQGTDRERANKANWLYQAAGRIVKRATNRRIRCSVENPLNSLAWLCDGMDDVLRIPDPHEIIFEHCMRGGDRDKSTRWWASDEVLLPLAIRCSKNHPHASWRPTVSKGRRVQFPTHEEAAYPALLCDRIASLLSEQYNSLLHDRQGTSGGHTGLLGTPAPLREALSLHVRWLRRMGCASTGPHRRGKPLHLVS